MSHDAARKALVRFWRSLGQRRCWTVGVVMRLAFPSGATARHRLGDFGELMTFARARHITRMHVLLLIAVLATLVAILAGLVAKARGLTRHFQANTERREPVLSLFFLGRELFHSARLRITFTRTA